MKILKLTSYLILLTLLFSFTSDSVVTKSSKNRPNILWIYLEDVSGWFSCYGDNIIETPNMDALANKGIRYNRYYATAGVCSASRSAVVTGMMQTTIGAHNHRSCRPGHRKLKFKEYDKNTLPEDVIPLPILFRKAGYYTFNEGGKDDYNFEWSKSKFYDFLRAKGGWGPKSFTSGDCLKGNTSNKPFFGQIQLGGGKLRRLPKVTKRSIVPVPPYYPDIPEVREEIAYHYDCLLKTDEQVGEIIDALKRTGQYENTIIFLFSDHGMKLHRHKQFLYEGGIKMPFILAGKDIVSGKVSEDLISGIDISATSLAMAGIKIPKSMEGQNILSNKYKKRKYLVAARDRCDFTIEKIRAIVTPKYKYLKNYLTDRPYMQPNYKDRWPVSKRFRKMMKNGDMDKNQRTFFSDYKPAEELYDLKNDPHELNNLAQDPNYKKVLKNHRKLLKKWVKSTGDKGQQPESDIGLKCVYMKWKNRCVNPEYDKFKR